MSERSPPRSRAERDGRRDRGREERTRERRSPPRKRPREWRSLDRPRPRSRRDRSPRRERSRRSPDRGGSSRREAGGAQAAPWTDRVEELGRATGCTLGEGHERGRRGTVFFGKDGSTGEGVAVKVPHAGEEAIVEAESRHCQRIREQLNVRSNCAASALMCPILRRGRVEAAGTPFHVMPRFPATLRAWGAAPRPTHEWAGLILQALYLAEALRGVDTFHGDYRPFNVMVAAGEAWTAPPGATLWSVPLPPTLPTTPAARVIDWEQSQLVQGRRARERRFSAGLRNLKDEVTLLHAVWRWREIEAAYTAVGGTHCDDAVLADYVRRRHPKHAARLDAGAKAYQVFDACMEEEAAAAGPGPVPASVRDALAPVFTALAASRKASGLQVGYVIDDATGDAVRAALPGCVRALVSLCETRDSGCGVSFAAPAGGEE